MCGIDNDKWHGIIAAVVVALVFVAVFPFLQGAVSQPVAFLLSLAIGIVVAHHLQAWNEARQAISPTIPLEYGSFREFQRNSRNDWRWFWRGILISWLIPLLLVWIFF